MRGKSVAGAGIKRMEAAGRGDVLCATNGARPEIHGMILLDTLYNQVYQGCLIRSTYKITCTFSTYLDDFDSQLF